ncbi:MAG TPA: hydroxysqualene dehydroxylase HpnE [Acidobacteriaceae bacterium]|nr:hydroxysqualene dehydroxylase HpnE [Acidobacteriaceae bacterium]
MSLAIERDPKSGASADLRSGAQENPRSVTVVGGGLAGISAACALAGAGYRVRLLERRPYLGGRASSYVHPGTGEVIDNCQHVLLGHCTNLIALYRRLGVSDAIRWFDAIHLVEPGGRRSVLKPGILPAPLHSFPAFLRAPAFTAADKLALMRGMSEFLRGLPPDSDENFAHWLARRHQTRGAVEHFWKPILISALNEDLDRISVKYAGQVIRMSLLESPAAGRMGVPSIPLSELYAHAAGYIEERGGQVLLRTSAEGFSQFEDGQWTVATPGGSYSSDAVIFALAFEGMSRLLPMLPQNPGAAHLSSSLTAFEHSPITGIHLWFDREITDLEHAMLLDRTIQWMFHKSHLQPRTRSAQGGSYVELVVSASKSLVERERQEIIDLAVAELGEFFPAVRQARLVKAAVVKEVRATYSVRPQLDPLRPAAVSPWPGIFLAGDWTMTNWPATMEGAVRSGCLAAEAFARAAGEPAGFLAPDLPPTGLMRFMR